MLREAILVSLQAGLLKWPNSYVPLLKISRTEIPQLPPVAWLVVSFPSESKGTASLNFFKEDNKSLPLFKDVIWTLKLVTKQHKSEPPRTRLQADPQTGKRAWLTEDGHAALSARMRLHTPWVSALATKVHKVKKRLSSSWKESSSCAMKKYFPVTGETLSQTFHTFQMRKRKCGDLVSFSISVFLRVS